LEPLNLPPHEGTWLGHSPRNTSDLSSIERFQLLSRKEFDEHIAAYEYFNQHTFKKVIRPLRKAHRGWEVAKIAALKSRALGPFSSHIAADALVVFLNCWRKTLDNLAHSVSVQFQKDSEQFRTLDRSRRLAFDTYFGYRVVESLRNMNQHMESPPIQQAIESRTYVCAKCGELHEEDSELTITLSCEWIRSGCSGFLKRELLGADFQTIDVAKAVSDSMAGFDDVMRALLLSMPEAKSHQDILDRVFRSATPNLPVLINYWTREDGEPHMSMQPLHQVRWILM